MKNWTKKLFLYSASALATALVTGCGSNNNNPPDGGSPDGGSSDGGVLGSGNLTSSFKAAGGSTFSLPFDAAPSPDGTQIYFTGVAPGAASNNPAIFKVAAGGGTPMALATGGSIGAPFGIAVASDGSTVFVADPAFATANDKGAIFSLATAGGAPTVLAETADYSPWAISVAKVNSADNIYFIGADKANGMTGIFKDVAGTVSVVVEGSAAGNPQAITAYTDGTIYFVNGTGIGKIAPGGTSATAVGTASTNLAVYFPAGIAVSQDGKFLLVPVTDPATEGESIARVNASTGAITQLGLSLGANQEGGGLHRAANADVYSFVDTGVATTGAVYFLK